MRAKLDKARLFQDLGYWPHAGQQAVHDSRALRRVLACGVRWGKTRVGVYEAVAALLEPHSGGSMGWVVGPDHVVSDRILKLAHRALEKHSPHRIVEARGHALRVQNLGGGVSEAQGRSADNPASLLGEGLDWLVVDEAARLRDEVWNEHLSQRLVERNGWALLLSTPHGPGWFYEAYRRGRAGERGYAAWTGPTWENPHIERAVIEAERAGLTPDVFAQEYEGKFIGRGIPQCETCGYGRCGFPSVPILRNGQEFAACRDCGHLVLPDGRSLAVDIDGQIVEYSITLLDRRRGPVEPCAAGSP
jgi:hypothetical protein